MYLWFTLSSYGVTFVVYLFVEIISCQKRKRKCCPIKSVLCCRLGSQCCFFFFAPVLTSSRYVCIINLPVQVSGHTLLTTAACCLPYMQLTSVTYISLVKFALSESLQFNVSLPWTYFYSRLIPDRWELWGQLPTFLAIFFVCWDWINPKPILLCLWKKAPNVSQCLVCLLKFCARFLYLRPGAGESISQEADCVNAVKL